MKSLYESILDTDKNVQVAISKQAILENIKNILIENCGSLKHSDSYKKWFYNRTAKGKDTYMIVFQYNLDNDDFSTKCRKLINKLNRINGVVINWHIVKTRNIFKNMNVANQELYEVKIFLDDDELSLGEPPILEFWISDIFVNYKTTANGLGLSFIVESKYKNFVDMFEGQTLR